jgi:hypothetical protein
VTCKVDVTSRAHCWFVDGSSFGAIGNEHVVVFMHVLIRTQALECGHVLWNYSSCKPVQIYICS